jgi:toxin HigB-1
MIRSFRNEATQDVFHGRPTRRFPPDIQGVARRKLREIHRATRLEDLREPRGNRLEKLEEDRAGQWSIRINDQWRICFIWDNGAHRVEITDYH